MDYKERYNEWLNNLSDNDPLKTELIEIKDNDTEIEERFFQNLAFGTAGLRGKVGAGTNRMNFLTVGKASATGSQGYILIASGEYRAMKSGERSQEKTFIFQIDKDGVFSIRSNDYNSISSYVPSSQIGMTIKMK